MLSGLWFGKQIKQSGMNRQMLGNWPIVNLIETQKVLLYDDNRAVAMEVGNRK
jgi:hypothetical protein